ncbi:MAG: hypothetical protein Q4C71_01355 [Microbacteriaceae bacterium]|nr:hypothetical protein [Microbacteriaceae bacterium]
MGVTENDAALASQITAELLELDQVNRVVRVSVGADENGARLVGAKVSLPVELTMQQVSIVVALAERRVQRVVPDVEHIFITPDVFYDAQNAPSTSTIVTLSYD